MRSRSPAYRLFGDMNFQLLADDLADFRLLRARPADARARAGGRIAAVGLALVSALLFGGMSVGLKLGLARHAEVALATLATIAGALAVTLVAALILGKAAFGSQGLVFPLIVPMIGVITAVAGIFFVAPRKSDRSGMTAINRGFFLSAIFSLALVVGAALWYLPSSFSKLSGVTDPAILHHGGNPQIFAIGAVLIGLVENGVPVLGVVHGPAVNITYPAHGAGTARRRAGPGGRRPRAPRPRQTPSPVARGSGRGCVSTGA